MPVDYSKAKIYKLTTIHNPDLVYYGSTVNPLYKRKMVHKSFFKSGNVSYSSFKLFELGIDDVEITLVENINCNSKEELHKRERFYIENNNCINKNIPCRKKKEYREKHKEEAKITQKEYYEKHKDLLNKKNKEYREKHKEEIKIREKEYRENHKDIKKEYYKKHKEEMKKKQRERYQQKKANVG